MYYEFTINYKNSQLSLNSLTDLKWNTFTSALSFGRLLRFHHVGMVKRHVIGYSQLQQELQVFKSQYI